MSERGLDLTLTAVRAHLTSMAWPRYELRLIDTHRRRCVATRYWRAAQLLEPDTVRFLRARNREGCEVYFRPHASTESPGYLLLDFDEGPCPLAVMRTAGHTPCVVVETSPGHHQAWVRVSRHSVSPGWATSVARGLALRYGADAASAEWRHLGRLAGFTNRKPARLQANGLPPWVRVVWQGGAALAEVDGCMAPTPTGDPVYRSGVADGDGSPLYQECLAALRLLERFPAPDWSIADYRVARLLLQQGWGAAPVAEILRQGSPGFPRLHPKPDDYLRRTVQSAAASLEFRPVFSRAPILPKRA
jgi:hypothetical protein